MSVQRYRRVFYFSINVKRLENVWEIKGRNDKTIRRRARYLRKKKINLRFPRRELYFSRCIIPREAAADATMKFRTRDVSRRTRKVIGHKSCEAESS